MNENIADKIIAMMDKAVELTDKKDFEEADNICAEVLKICPGFPDALHIKGIVNQELGKSNDAMDLILTAIKNSPKIHFYYISLANIYMKSAEYIDAIDACNSALNLMPNSSEAHRMLATVYRETGEIDKAIRHLENAIQYEPSNIQLQCKYAVFIAETGNIKAAFDICLPLKEKNPDNADLTQSLGYIYELDHDFEKAKQYYYESLHLDPKNSTPYLKLAYLDKNTHDNKDLIIKLEEILINENVPYFEKSCLNCSLGKLYEDIGDYNKSFNYYEAANNIIKSKNSYSRETHTLYITRIINNFTPHLFDIVQAEGLDTELPVFIVGMPRSGTSLVEQILSSHPDIYGAGELSNIMIMTNHMHNKLQTSRKYPRCIKHVDKRLIREYGNNYIHALREKSDSALRIINKSPFNYMHVGFIFMMFPNAKIIHCKRNPLDVCFSNYAQVYLSQLFFSYDLVDLGHYYLEYNRIMEHWYQLFPDKIFNLNYEDLVNQNEKVTRSLIDYCELPWNSKCLASHENKRFIRTSSYAQVRKPIYKSSLERWKRYERHIGPLKEMLAGYY